MITIRGGVIDYSDSMRLAKPDSLDVELQDSVALAVELSRRELRMQRRADSIRLNQPQPRIFRDSISISRMSAISFAVPGFSQFYNKQTWKIPVLYGVAGGLTYLTVKANKNYRRYNREYEALRTNPETMYNRDLIDPVQTKMIRYNTQKSIFMMGAIAAYLYFIGDGALNYPHYTTNVKKATTLAMIFPGAGQIYNKSYWKVPIVIGGFATMGYIIDFNNRGYQRFKRAYNEYPNDEFMGYYPQNMFQNLRDQYRRNRDLSIILTGALYILSVVEAHSDAYMKDFEVTDDLSMRMRVEPTLIDMGPLPGTYYASGGYSGMQAFGLALRVNF